MSANIQRQLVLGFALITTLGSLGRLPKTNGNPEGGEKEGQQKTASVKSNKRNDAIPSGLHHSLLFREALQLTDQGQFELAISKISAHPFDQLKSEQRTLEGLRLNNLGTLYLIQSFCIPNEVLKQNVLQQSEISFTAAQAFLQESDCDLAVCLENQSLLAQNRGLHQKAIDLKKRARLLFERCSNAHDL